MPTSTSNIIFDVSVNGMGSVIGQFQSLNTTINNTNNIINNFGRSAGAAGNILQTAFGYATGRAIVGTLQSIGSGLMSIASEAQNSIGNFERLGGVINVAAAREMQENTAVKERIKTGTALGVLNKKDAATWAALSTTWKPSSLANMQLDLQQAQTKLNDSYLRQAKAKGPQKQFYDVTISESQQRVQELQGKIASAQTTYDQLLTKQGPQAITEEVTRQTMGLDQALQASSGIVDKYLLRMQAQILHAPVAQETMAKMFQTLAGYGTGHGNQLGVVETSFQLAQGMSNFGIASGKSNEQLYDMSVAMGQVQSKGKLMAEEMNKQFTNAGVTMNDVIKAFDLAYPKFGLTASNFQDWMKGGKITAAMFVDAMRQYFNQWDAAAQRMKGTWAYLPVMLQNVKDTIMRIGFTGIFEELKKPLNAFVDLFDPAKNPGTLDGIKAMGDSIGQFIKPAMDYLAGPAISKLNDFLIGWKQGGGIASGIANMLGWGIRGGVSQWDFKSLAEEAAAKLNHELDIAFNGTELAIEMGGGWKGGLLAGGFDLGTQLITNMLEGMRAVFSGGKKSKFSATTGVMSGVLLASLLGISPLLMIPLGAGLGITFKDSLVANLMPKVEDITAELDKFTTEFTKPENIEQRNQALIGMGEAIGAAIQAGLGNKLSDEEGAKNIWYEFGKALFKAQGAVLGGWFMGSLLAGMGTANQLGNMHYTQKDLENFANSSIISGVLGAAGMNPNTMSMQEFAFKQWQEAQKQYGPDYNPPESWWSGYNMSRPKTGQNWNDQARKWTDTGSAPSAPYGYNQSGGQGWGTPSAPKNYAVYKYAGPASFAPGLGTLTPGSVYAAAELAAAGINFTSRDWSGVDVTSSMVFGTQGKMQPNYPGGFQPKYSQRVEPSGTKYTGTGGYQPPWLSGFPEYSPMAITMGGGPSAIEAATGETAATTAPIAELSAQVQSVIDALGQGPQAAEMFKSSVTDAATSVNAQMTAAQSIIQQMATVGYPQLSQVAMAWQQAQVAGLTNLAGILQFIYQLMTGMNLGANPSLLGGGNPYGDLSGGQGKPDAHARQGHFRTSAGRYENPFTSGFDLSYLSPEQILTATTNYNKQQAASGQPLISAMGARNTTQYVQNTADNTKQSVVVLGGIYNSVQSLPGAIADLIGGGGGKKGGKGAKSDKTSYNAGQYYASLPDNYHSMVPGFANGTDFTTPSGTSNDRYPFMALLSGNERVKIVPNYLNSSGMVMVNKSVNISKVEINSGMSLAVFKTMMSRALAT